MGARFSAPLVVALLVPVGGCTTATPGTAPASTAAPATTAASDASAMTTTDAAEDSTTTASSTTVAAGAPATAPPARPPAAPTTPAATAPATTAAPITAPSTTVATGPRMVYVVLASHPNITVCTQAGEQVELIFTWQAAGADHVAVQRPDGAYLLNAAPPISSVTFTHTCAAMPSLYRFIPIAADGSAGPPWNFNV